MSDDRSASAVPPASDPITARLRHRRRMDRGAKWVVSAGGIGIICLILAILVFIVAKVAPLVSGAELTEQATYEVNTSRVLALCADEAGEGVVTLDDRGVLLIKASEDATPRRYDLLSGEGEGREIAEGEELPAAGRIVHARHKPNRGVLAMINQAGEVRVLTYRWKSTYTAEGRSVRFEHEVIPVAFPDLGGPATVVAATGKHGGDLSVVAQRGDGKVHGLSISRTWNDFMEEWDITESRSSFEVPDAYQELVCHAEGTWIYGLTASGDALHAIAWSDPRHYVMEADLPGAKPTAFATLKGDQSVLIGRADGQVEVWTPARVDNAEYGLHYVRSFDLGGDRVEHLAPSLNDKGFLALGAQGHVRLFYNTSERLLWSGKTKYDGASAVHLAPRGGYAMIASPGHVERYALKNPHPDAGFGAFFAPVHYEGFPDAAYTWQSSSAEDDYEAKLSMVPLIVGTLKGTLFSLLLAVPLAVLAALFTSQFLHPSVKGRVKPVIEIMAALPSVVLGLIAGLWLAPRVEQVIVGVLALGITLPLTMIGSGTLYARIPPALRKSWPHWAEVAFYMGTIALGTALTLLLSGPLESLFFGGSFTDWMLETLGLRYDQRNAVVVAIAMGFATIPIIYTISEDAFSNVPRNLGLGSRALGATQWQTVSKVVLPTASPGIFSAVMVGFGRAVGETMIVLMATGNTAILDWNAFNGFRTLSANIAVELPEAPVDGTLYRALFLAALMLFVLTFFVNTLAELVRERLRRKFGRM